MYNKSLLHKDFDRAAHLYEKHAEIQHIVAQNVARKFQEIAPNYKNNLTLDIGSGTGALSKLLPDYSIIQLDLSLNMCRESQKYNSVINADIEKLPFADNSFDNIISSLAMQWCNNLPEFFAEISRVLKPDGKILLSTFGEKTICELKQVFQEVEGNASRINKFHSKNELLQLSSNLHISSDTLTITYSAAVNLLKNIQLVGGSNKSETRNKHLSKQVLRDIDRLYSEQFPCPTGIYASWEVYYLTYPYSL